MKIRPLRDNVILHKLETGDIRTKSGIYVPDDSTMVAGERGIKHRWAQVLAVGPEQENVAEGQWVLMEHGRWTEGQDVTLTQGERPVRIWLADTKGIMMVSDTKPDQIIERGM